jgi:hypothetical protein
MARISEDELERIKREIPMAEIARGRNRDVPPFARFLCGGRTPTLACLENWRVGATSPYRGAVVARTRAT